MTFVFSVTLATSKLTGPPTVSGISIVPECARERLAGASSQRRYSIIVKGNQIRIPHASPKESLLLSPRQYRILVRFLQSWLGITLMLDFRPNHGSIMIPLFAFALFLPTIIVGLGYSSLHAQLLTVPPNICGCLATILFGIGSDRLGVRGPFVLAGSLLSLVGYTILLATTTPTIGYIGTIIAACGLVPSSACLLAWTGGNAGGDMKRGAMLAMLTGLGDLGA